MEEGFPGNVSYKCDFPSHLLTPSEKEGLVFGPSSSFPFAAAESGDSRRKGEGREIRLTPNDDALEKGGICKRGKEAL